MMKRNQTIGFVLHGFELIPCGRGEEVESVQMEKYNLKIIIGIKD